jgi:uncharacterized protein (DUF58 family)
VWRHPYHHAAAHTEFHGLREFRSGDSPRWIHWRTSARCGELMVREFADPPTDNLVLIVEPWVPARPAPGPQAASSDVGDQRVEEAISLAATICWEWCRQAGARFVLAVAGADPVIMEGITGRELALGLLECLAVQAACAEPATAALADRLAARALPSGPALLVSTRGSAFAETLGVGLHRPIAALDVAHGLPGDVYEGGEGHAA